MFSVDQLISDCLDAASDSPGHSGVAIEEVLSRVISDPGAIESAIGHPRHQASMTTWHRSREMTVLHMVWPPAVSLAAHDHLMWAAIGIYGGQEDNDLFRPLEDGTLEQRKSVSVRRPDKRIWTNPTEPAESFDIEHVQASMEQARERAARA